MLTNLPSWSPSSVQRNCMLVNKNKSSSSCWHLRASTCVVPKKGLKLSWYLDRVSGLSSYHSHGYHVGANNLKPRLPDFGLWFSRGLASFLSWVCLGWGWGCQGSELRLNTTLSLNSTSGKSRAKDRNSLTLSGQDTQNTSDMTFPGFRETRGGPQNTVSRFSKSMEASSKD